MKLVLAVALVLAGQAASANLKVLDCSISYGEDQQVTVEQTDKGIKLTTERNMGGKKTWDITSEQLESGELNLSRDADEVAIFRQTDSGDWLYLYRVGTFTQQELAYCK